ncbi:MAG: hypothetical protein PHX86_02945 [Caldisericia bacterium]|nr:hypothetical protein [Caldisericia bacterium]
MKHVFMKVVLISFIAISMTSCSLQGNTTNSSNTTPHQTKATFTEATQQIKQINEQNLDFSEDFAGFVFIWCPMQEYLVKDITCSDYLLEYYNSLQFEAQKYHVAFSLVLGSMEKKTFNEIIVQHREQYGVEVDFDSVNEKELKYTIFYDQENIFKDTYEIVAYPSMLFMDSKGSVIDSDTGWSVEQLGDFIDKLKSLYTTE